MVRIPNMVNNKVIFLIIIFFNLGVLTYSTKSVAQTDVNITLTVDNSTLCYNDTSVNFQLTATARNGVAPYSYRWMVKDEDRIYGYLGIEDYDLLDSVNIQNFNFVTLDNPKIVQKDYRIIVMVLDGHPEMEYSYSDDTIMVSIYRRPETGNIFHLSNKVFK